MKRIGLTPAAILLVAFPLFSQKYNHVDIDTLLSLGNIIYCHSTFAPNDTVIWADFASEIHRSLDRGDTWEKIAVPVEVPWTSLRPMNTDTAFFSAIYSGFYKTIDGGKTWEDLNKDENHPNHFHFFDNDEGIMLDAKLKIPYKISGIGDTLRIWKTLDGGFSWIEINEPDRPAFLPGEVFYHRANNMNRQTIGDTIIFGTSLGRVFRSYDRGNTWEAFYTGLGKGQFIISIAQHSSKNMMVLSDGGSYGKEFKSSFTNDDGETWTTRSLNDGCASIAAIPGHDSSFVLLKGTYMLSKGVFLTHDGGNTYSRKLFDVPCHTLTFIDDSTAIMPSTYKNSGIGSKTDYIFRLSFREVPVYIPDPAFLHALIDEGVDTNGDSLISFEEAEAVVTLDIGWNRHGNHSRISDLTGIESFVNLDTLVCYWNELTSLDLSNNTALRYLDLSANNITDLDISKNYRLEYLDLGSEPMMESSVPGNPLGTLDVSRKFALKYLKCDYCKLTNLDVSKCIGLAYLKCNWNQLSSLDVSGCTALKEFDCSSNQLTSLDVSKNFELNNLNCAVNQLATLDVSKNIDLESLDCSSNILTSLDVSNNTALISLYARNNQYWKLDVSNNTALERLNCSNTDLAFLNIVNNPQIVYLNLCCNFNLWQVCVWTMPFPPEEVFVDTSISMNAYFTTECTIGNEEHQCHDILIYPNPTSTLLTIETDIFDVYHIEIAALNGQQIFSSEMKGTSHQIDLSTFEKGVYFITIRSDDFVTTRKIIKL